jgi:lipoprotein signal peptidase
VNKEPSASTETEDALEETSKHDIQRWPAFLALLVIVVGYSEISEKLAPFPRFAVPAIVIVGILLIALAISRGRHLLVRPIALILIGAITLAEIVSTLLLVSILPRGAIGPTGLLQDAALIWVINVVTFALWYWEIDGGGPLMRKVRPHQAKDFLFPQQASGYSENWTPKFIDYLFLAFNHSAAFSPTDTAVLSRRAKVLVMIQAALSLMAIAVLIAKAINSL